MSTIEVQFTCKVLSSKEPGSQTYRALRDIIDIVTGAAFEDAGSAALATAFKAVLIKPNMSPLTALLSNSTSEFTRAFLHAVGKSMDFVTANDNIDEEAAAVLFDKITELFNLESIRTVFSNYELDVPAPAQAAPAPPLDDLARSIYLLADTETADTDYSNTDAIQELVKLVKAACAEMKRLRTYETHPSHREGEEGAVDEGAAEGGATEPPSAAVEIGAMATAVVATSLPAATILGSEDSGLVTADDGMKYPAFASVRMCVEAGENTMTKVVNQNFSVDKWSPPIADITDKDGVMLFPAADRFEILPGGIVELEREKVKTQLESLGFAKEIVAKMTLPKRKQLLQWKMTEMAFIRHEKEHPAPAGYARATTLRPAWTEPPSAAAEEGAAEGGATKPPSVAAEGGATVPPSAAVEEGATVPPSAAAEEGATVPPSAAVEGGATVPPSAAAEEGATEPTSVAAEEGAAGIDPHFVVDEAAGTCKWRYTGQEMSLHGCQTATLNQTRVTHDFLGSGKIIQDVNVDPKVFKIEGIIDYIDYHYVYVPPVSSFSNLVCQEDPASRLTPKGEPIFGPEQVPGVNFDVFHEKYNVQEMKTKLLKGHCRARFNVHEKNGDATSTDTDGLQYTVVVDMDRANSDVRIFKTVETEEGVKEMVPFILAVLKEDLKEEEDMVVD